MTQVTETPAAGGGQERFHYDAMGQRVAKYVTNGPIHVYVYDVFGHLAAEYSTAAPSSTLPCSTCYLSTDHLGSTRLITDESASIISRHDYVPFGEEIPANTAGRGPEWGPLGDNVNQKFTGQERDTETGLDFFHARYMSAAQGRFNSPDPMNAGADLTNPQSWNGYAYVNGNPLAFVDPTGKCTADGRDKNGDFCFTGGTSENADSRGTPEDAYQLLWITGYFGPVYSFSGLYEGHAPQRGSGNGGGGGQANPAKNVARPDWLNNITSIFGYDQRIPLPSCFGDFVNSTINNLLPFLPGLSNISEEGFGAASRATYNRALTYAATTPSKTFGTSFLKYPFKSNVFRGLLSKSASLADAAPMAGVVTGEGQALYNEIQTMKQGECQ